MRARHEFIWSARLKPIGLPIAAAAALFALRGDRSVRRAVGAAATTLGLAYLGGNVEYEFRRARWRRAQLAERRRLREIWRQQTGT